MKLKHVIWVLLFTVVACIDPLTLKNVSDQQAIVIDGIITDQPGPYTVTIFNTLTLNQPYGGQTAVRGAAITIKDDKGNTEKLIETSAGVYQTSTMRGEVGNTYKIQIVTGDNNYYESDPETILPVGEISKVYYEFVQASSDIRDPGNGFNLYLDGKILPENQGLVRWSWTGVFEVATYPQDHKKPPMAPPPAKDIPDPPACSGYVYNSPEPHKRPFVYYVGPCTCCDCWVTEYNAVPLLSDQRFISGDKAIKVPLGFLPASNKYFFDKYHFEVRQMSISNGAYDFWSKVAQQKLNGSNLFQAPPAKTGGNIHAITKGSLPVIGLFTAASVSIQTMFITRNEIPYLVAPNDSIQADCTKAYLRSSTVRPDFWY